jgi:aldehyde oxidoreductase
MDREALAAILGHGRGRVRIVPTGGRGRLRLEARPVGAALSCAGGAQDRAARAHGLHPPRIHGLDHQAPPGRDDRAAGRDADGPLHGDDVRRRFNTGAYASWGPTVANRVPVHASGPYRLPNYRAEPRRCTPIARPRAPSAASACRRRRSRRKAAAGRGWPTGWASTGWRSAAGTRCATGSRRSAGRSSKPASASPPASRRCARAWARARAAAEAFNARRAGSLKRGVGVAAAGMAAATPRCPTPRPSRRGSAPTAGWCCIRARWISARARTP